MSPEVIAILIGAAGFIVTVIVTIIKFTDRLTKAEGAVEASKRAEALADKVTADLADFRAHVAREYVTSSAIQRIEERLVQAIERLGDRLDRAFERPKPGS